MKKVLITGSLGLIGYTAALFYLKHDYFVIGIDNDFRTKSLDSIPLAKRKLSYLKKNYPSAYQHYHADIQNDSSTKQIFRDHQNDISLILHTAAQTSHDWSKLHPVVDYSINAVSTLQLLERFREFAPEAVFIFTSTNKVYGDRVNLLSFEETRTRFDLSDTDQYFPGINEHFSVDQSIHSVFGVSKLSADLLVQEYARYYGLKTAVFRLGVVTGPGQSGAFLQGFLAHMLCKAKRGELFQIVGYKGKQVRDIIHAEDVVRAFHAYYKSPHPESVYNLGGGRANSASVLELIQKLKDLFNIDLQTSIESTVRQGDHQWWITDTTKFKKNYPDWQVTYTLDDILTTMYNQTI